MTITLTREEAQQVLDALIDAADSQNWEMQQNIDQHGEWYRRSRYLKQAVAKSQETIETLRARLSAPEPEPVAELWQHGETGRTRIITPDMITDCGANWIKVSDLYTTPPQREWQGLTDEEVVQLLGGVRERLDGDVFGGFARAIEAKLKEKNT